MGFTLKAGRKHRGLTIKPQEDPLVRKDKDAEPDWKELTSLLEQMRAITSKSIQELKDTDETAFRRVVAVVRHLYETPDDYEKFHHLVVSSFKDQAHIIPGTVGAYFGGCLSETTGARGCSAICAGSLPLSRETANANSYCEFPVFLQQTTSAGRKMFTQMNAVKNNPKAIIYVEDDPETFTGLTGEEVAAFKARGIEEVKILNHNQTDDTSTWRAIDVTGRAVIVTTAPPTNNGWILLAIIIILIILVAGYMAYKKKQESA